MFLVLMNHLTDKAMSQLNVTKKYTHNNSSSLSHLKIIDIGGASIFLSIFILISFCLTIAFNSLFLLTIGRCRNKANYSSLNVLCYINLSLGLVLLPFTFVVHMFPHIISDETQRGQLSCQIFGVVLAFHHRISTQGFCLLQLER